MLRGYVDEISATRITGWALDDTDLRRPINVEVMVGGVQYASPRADLLRRDLEREFGYGHHAFAFEFNPPLPLIRDHQVLVRYSGTEQTVPNGERVIRGVTIAPEAMLRPILVTASGRAGSTILMKKMVAHPAISVANVYPFETELLKYYSHAFSILSAPGDHERSGKPENFVDNHRFLGANPYNVTTFARAFRDLGRFDALYQQVVPREAAGAFRAIITQFYQSLGEDQNKPGAIYFAEKCQLSGMARWFARNLFSGTREIVLVRDLRDTLCSFKSFWSQSSSESIRLLKLSYASILEIRKEARDDILFVRYEDLMQEEVATLGQVADFLGVRAFQIDERESEKELFSQHGTSKSPADSIGRWKRELSIEEVKECVREFGPYLEELGYEV